MSSVREAAKAPLSIVPYRAWRISFACNDPYNGSFLGQVDLIEIESLYRVGRHPWDASFYHPSDEGVRFSVDYDRLSFRIHRQTFPFKTSREWVGNWCWNEFVVTRNQGKRLLYAMQRHGWKCDEGATPMHQWFNRAMIAAREPEAREGEG